MSIAAPRPSRRRHRPRISRTAFESCLRMPDAPTLRVSPGMPSGTRSVWSGRRAHRSDRDAPRIRRASPDDRLRRPDRTAPDGIRVDDDLGLRLAVAAVVAPVRSPVLLRALAPTGRDDLTLVAVLRELVDLLRGCGARGRDRCRPENHGGQRGGLHRARNAPSTPWHAGLPLLCTGKT